MSVEKSIRARSVAFTLNNPSVGEEQYINALFEDCRDENHIRFAGFGKEVGEEGTPHLQGFIYFSNGKSFATIHRLPGLTRAHFEVIKGSVQQNIDYCSKEGQYKQFGEAPKQGRRSDLDAVVDMVESGKRVSDVSLECPLQFIKFHKGIERLIAMRVPPRDFKTEVLWYWGPTGTGKSRTAFEKATSASSYYVKDPLNKWWDGYEQQEVVIIDDYRRDFSTFAHLLRLFDRYPMTVEMKGSTTNFSSRTLIVTSPKSPRDTWDTRSPEDIQQLLRRIDKVVHFDVLRREPPSGQDLV